MADPRLVLAAAVPLVLACTLGACTVESVAEGRHRDHASVVFPGGAGARLHLVRAAVDGCPGCGAWGAVVVADGEGLLGAALLDPPRYAGATGGTLEFAPSLRGKRPEEVHAGDLRTDLPLTPAQKEQVVRALREAFRR